jgi:hypothetical protein
MYSVMGSGFAVHMQCFVVAAHNIYIMLNKETGTLPF